MMMLFESSSSRSELCAPNERKDGANPTDAAVAPRLFRNDLRVEDIQAGILGAMQNGVKD